MLKSSLVKLCNCKIQQPEQQDCRWEFLMLFGQQTLFFFLLLQNLWYRQKQSLIVEVKKVRFVQFS